MGRQCRIVHPWEGLWNCHFLHNHYIHRQYRWTAYLAHPNNVFGKPFKGRNGKRISPSVLSTPDVLKFHVPIAYAFVPINQEKTVDKHTGKFIEAPKRRSGQLLSSGQYKLNSECQKTVLNYNKCLKNVGEASCQFYMNTLNRNCLNN